MTGRGVDSVNEPIVWLSTKDASERLGITLRSLYRFIDEGDLVAYKFGRVIRIQESDVDQVHRGQPDLPGQPRAPLSRGQGQRSCRRSGQRGASARGGRPTGPG